MDSLNLALRPGKQNLQDGLLGLLYPLVPFFRKIKSHYGDPLSLVNHMGRGILSAVNSVFPGILDLLRHFHFLRDIASFRP